MHSVAWLSTVCPRLSPAFWRGLDRRAILPLLGGGVTRSTHCVEMATREHSRHLSCSRGAMASWSARTLPATATTASAAPRIGGRERRWVVYAGDVEIDGSMVPPSWHAWLGHSREKAPSEQPPPIKRWEKEHQLNLSGSPQAYVPPGHEHRGGQRAKATGDYEAWRP